MRAPKSGLERYLPLAYMFVALGLIIMLLPTALRPPQAPPPTSSEFSPDAPPDDQEILLTELSQGKSRTAGSAGAFGGDVVEEADVDAPRVRQAPRKGRCFGTPPRQTDSSYSPPCAPAFTGKNPGATHKGVTATEIRVGVVGATSDVGPVPTTPTNNESPTRRTLRVWQQYFNERFELFGRQLRLYVVSSSSEASGTPRAAVQKADEEFGVFAMIPASADGADEAARRKLVNMGNGSSASPDTFVNFAPYFWSWYPTAETHLVLLAEMACKQLAGRPVKYTTDVTAIGKERVWGSIMYNDVTHHHLDEFIEREMAKCGQKIRESVLFNITDQAGEIATAMAKMKAAGVTTILSFQDFASTAATTQAAGKAAYFPEWLPAGGFNVDMNTYGRTFDQTQWKYSLGLSWNEMPAPVWQRDHYRAYKDVDPDGEPEGARFYDILQLVGGFQQAGPVLNPFTFQEGMFRRWPRRPAEHVWAVAGGYQQGDWAYPDYMPFIWWDAEADDPLSDLPGAYRYMYGGRRFTFGEMPAESPWHQRDGAVVWVSRDSTEKSW